MLETGGSGRIPATGKLNHTLYDMSGGKWTNSVSTRKSYGGWSMTVSECTRAWNDRDEVGWLAIASRRQAVAAADKDIASAGMDRRAEKKTPQKERRKQIVRERAAAGGRKAKGRE